MDQIQTPLTRFKYCPFCSSNDIKATCEKSIFCNSCKATLFTNSAAAVAAVITIDDKILFTVRNRKPSINKLDLPGGFVDLNETAENAVKREIKEELNLDVTNIKYITSIPNNYTYKNVNYNTTDLFYSCEVSSLSQVKLDDEIKDYKLLSIDEIDIENDIGLDSMKSFLKYFL